MVAGAGISGCGSDGSGCGLFAASRWSTWFLLPSACRYLLYCTLFGGFLHFTVSDLMVAWPWHGCVKNPP